MDSKTMRCLGSKRLEKRAIENNIKNLASDELYKIGLNAEIIPDIQECITSNYEPDIKNGLYFLNGLLGKYKLKEFGVNFIRLLINRLPFIIENQGTQAFKFALIYYVHFREEYQNYRKQMLKFLNSDVCWRRYDALRFYETFCFKNEIEPLFSFEHDNHVSEFSMCGPLAYEYRDLALEKIGLILGKNFMTKPCSEYHPDWARNVT